ncbi:hypothetical protein BEH94_11740 [Candidatus Altiarchaeales archaeon WOR_SM1_SCG]|nr:hypothetical protein BEH94_11740 [Candidatus Altiarchaeales archaeon WOR_SM1_SCG]
MTSIFNPFGKPFKDVEEIDLNTLNTVAEGWYVEYKREKQKGKKIAKSISSFANSYGGIYFVGIEHDDKTNCAKNILGVDDSPDIIRDSVSGNLQPFPYFETFSIPLAIGKKVIMVVISEGGNPPYIHSDGRIYRRQEAASEPIHESNRHTVDMLYTKAEKYMKKLEEFRKIDYNFCMGESNPHLEIFINTKPFNHFTVPDLFNNAKFSEILSKFSEKYTIKEKIGDSEVSIGGNIPFDTLNTYPNSIAIRQRIGNDITYNGLTVELDIYGNTKILIPLINAKLDDYNKFDENYMNVTKKYHPDSFYSLTFLDPINIFGGIMGILNRYSNFLLSYGYEDSIEIKVRLINCYGSTLYFYSKRFIEHIEKCGLPVCMKEEQYFPEVPIEIKNEDLKTKPFMSPLTVFSIVSMALGTPSNIALSSIFEHFKIMKP